MPRPAGVKSRNQRERIKIRTAARILPRVRHLAAHFAPVEVADDAVRSPANNISIDCFVFGCTA